MQELKTTIIPNPYFWIPDGATLLTPHFDDIDCKINYIKLLLKYPVPSYDRVDLFQFIDNESLDQLRNDKTVLIFDSVFEGFSPDIAPIATALYNSCITHNINPKKTFYFTGNLIDSSAEINIIPIFALDNYHDWKNTLISGLEEARSKCCENYEKIILSLSRRNRSHRVLAHQSSLLSLKLQHVFYLNLQPSVGKGKNYLRGIKPKVFYLQTAHYSPLKIGALFSRKALTPS
jgi:hypothetical protein